MHLIVILLQLAKYFIYHYYYYYYYYNTVSKKGHPFCFCYNFVICDRIFVIFDSFVSNEI